MHFKIFHGSNNMKTFKDFTVNMLKKVRNKATVYLDNLSVHHSKVITELFGERVDCRFLPPYSCALNPIERLWHLVKKQWRERIIGCDHMSDKEAIDLLTELMIKHKEIAKSVAHSHEQTLIKSLQGQFV